MTRAQWLFAFAVGGLGIASGIHETSFNNYLSEIFSIGANTRGILEFPREAPGLLAVLIAGALISMGLVKVALIAVSLIAVGYIGLGVLSPNFSMMLLWMIIWSIGNHLFMPLEGSIAVGLAEGDKVGQVLGKIGSIRIGATLIGAAIIWLGMGSFLPRNLDYKHTYLIAFVFVVAAVWCLSRISPIAKKGHQPKLVWHRKYSTFYLLCLLWGVRKQIFITFAPWLLVQTFQQPASVIAQLWIVTSILGVFFRPYLGKLSDNLGERTILLIEVPLVSLVFIGYGLAPSLEFGLTLVYVCYIIDSVLNGIRMVHTSYVSKILLNPNDLAPTLAMGVSMDHLSSMLMPIIGGLLWSGFGSTYLFLLAILGLLINGFVVYKQIPPPSILTPNKTQAL